ncbi:MAG: hypothetical protein L6V95_01960 [Candidatus Melainabacteria bacterium]|nr:MAG: hypothetical protein L6V95_01960 [Candidatus Melainabacteria bacterium]
MMAVINNPDLYDISEYEVLKYPVDSDENFLSVFSKLFKHCGKYQLQQ